MKFFSKEEALVIICILIVLAGVSAGNFRIAARRARDAQRKNDIGALTNALNSFANDFGVYPLSSSDGNILACRPEVHVENGKTRVSYETCEWGKDGLRDELTPDFPPYLSSLPSDPQNQAGVGYLYLSNGRRFQVFAHLEGEDEDEFEPRIVARGLSCGSQVCNFGLSSGVPLDKSIETYENELLEKNR